MKTLTIFTPTFNRAYCIQSCYESLCRQTSNDFEWLVIDDGSTDNTKELIDSFISENKISIKYVYQENQGMHGAHNAAYRIINTELNVCIDSDDFMPEDAVESIVSFWKNKGNKKYAGIIALDQAVNGDVIGTEFPENMKETTLIGFYKSGGKGDKKLIYRTDVINKYPEYPLFEGEKYVNLAYKYSLIDQDYALLTLNKVVCYVDYRSDGSSMNMYKQYWKNPKGFAFIRINDMKIVSKTFPEKFKTCTHYVSSSIIARNRYFIKESPLKLITILAIPTGFLLYLWIRSKVKRNIQLSKPQ